MKGRGRAEILLALAYIVIAPFALFAAAFVQMMVWSVTWSPTLPYELDLLLNSVPAFMAGILFYAVMRLAAHGLPGVSLVRWPARMAPIVLAAMLPTGAAIWLVGVRGHTSLNGLVVLPALIMWGAAAGEWFMHRQLGRGADGGRVLNRLFRGAAAAVGSLVIAAWVLRSPKGELDLARRDCERDYADARTARDSAMRGMRTPVVGRELGTRTCAELLADTFRAGPRKR